VGLCRDLLRRSAKPGDSVLDPFCGTGVIYPACHEVKCKATGIELDPAACGIAAQRLKELK
jgi:DNA modification methylase